MMGENVVGVNQKVPCQFPPRISPGLAFYGLTFLAQLPSPKLADPTAHPKLELSELGELGNECGFR